ERPLNLLDRTTAARSAHVRDFLADVVAIAWQRLGERRQLTADAPCRDAQPAEGEQDDHRDGGGASDAALKPADGRSEQEGQQDGDGQRDEDGLGPVEDRDDQYAASKRNPGTDEARKLGHGVPPDELDVQTRCQGSPRGRAPAWRGLRTRLAPCSSSSCSPGSSRRYRYPD